ncbi:uncharacterized protein LOC141665290 [Apium graveolens]|uniref:uncharacterized protein LOC141665290 n=1 Tax=Apium graveolens TaxID=4045 RepID=UPI003D7A63C4
MPLQSIENQTPYFRLHKESASLDHLRVFGCVVYFSTTKVNRSKFDPRAAIGVFVGYSNSQKGYKVFDLQSNSLCVTRDIVFQETMFPYKIISSKNYTTSQFLDDIFVPDLPSTDSSSVVEVEQNVSTQSSSSVENNSTDTSIFSPHNSSPSSDIRHSTRIKTLPAYLKDYHCNSATSENSSVHWCNLISGNSLPVSHHSLLSSYSAITEPANYKEASQHPLWLAAIKKELQALEANQTWELVSLPQKKTNRI